MRKLALLTMLFILAAISGFAFGPKPSNVIVTSTIADSDDGFAPYSLQSDSLGSYLNGTNSVVSQIQGIGDWELNMLSSATRRMNVNFNDLVPGSNPSNQPTPSSGYHPVRFITQCSGYGYSLLTLTAAGQNATCGLVVAIDISSVRYSLRFHPRYYSGTDTVLVGCTLAADNKCNGWRMQSPNGTGKLIAQVYKETTVRGKTVLTDHGKYRFSFDLSFAKP